MDDNPSGKEQHKAKEAIPDNKVVAADDDNTPHLENMANVQGSNKSSSSSNNPSQNRNVEKEVNSKTNTGVEA